MAAGRDALPPCEHRSGGTVVLGATIVRDRRISAAVEVDHRDGEARRRDTNGVAAIVDHTDRPRRHADGRETIGERRREAVGHEAAVGMSGGVDATRVDGVGAREEIDDVTHEADVVALVASVDRGVPLARIAECLRVDDDESLGVRLVAHPGVALEVLGGLAMTVQDDDERDAATGVEVRGEMQAIRAHDAGDAHVLHGGRALGTAVDAVSRARDAKDRARERARQRKARTRNARTRNARTRNARTRNARTRDAAYTS